MTHGGHVPFAAALAVAGRLLQLSLYAQTPGNPPQPTTLRVTTHLVEVSVVAETKDGAPAPGLTADDFALYDQGRQEQIAVFSAPAQPASPGPQSGVPPDTFTNRVDRAIGPNITPTVILFDGLNTHIADQAYARRQIVKFVEQLQPGERVALYVLGRGPRILQDFTDDPSTLLKALESFTGEYSPSLEEPLYDPAIPAPRHFQSWLGELSFNLIEHFDADRAFRTARTIVSVAGHLERLPGRKNMIWVAGSFPVSFELDSLPAPRKTGRRPRTVSPEIDRAARALNNANVAVYPVDARGLMAPQEYRADRAEASQAIPGRDQAMFATMRVLAGRTGGRAFYNNNDLRAAMNRAMEDSRKSYTLGYYPSHDSWNGKFREIRVRVNRPGVELHHRGGYFAQPDEPSEPWYREQILDAATWSPLDATRLGLTVQVARLEDGTLELDLLLDARDLSLVPKDGGWQCGLDLWLVQLDSHEQHLTTKANTNNLRLNQTTYEQVLKSQGLRLLERLRPEPGAALLRVLVRDIASGALGSVTIPLARLRPP